MSAIKEGSRNSRLLAILNRASRGGELRVTLVALHPALEVGRVSRNFNCNFNVGSEVSISKIPSSPAVEVAKSLQF